MAFKRIYVIVMDSVGIGEEPDAALFNDVGSNTIVHAAESVNGLNVPTLEKLGLGELEKIPGVVPVTDHPKSYVAKLREKSNGRLKTGWYSGKPNFPAGCSIQSFDYVKLGPYISACGGLRSPGTNQRMYRIVGEDMVDITVYFQK